MPPVPEASSHRLLGPFGSSTPARDGGRLLSLAPPLSDAKPRLGLEHLPPRSEFRIPARVPPRAPLPLPDAVPSSVLAVWAALADGRPALYHDLVTELQLPPRTVRWAIRWLRERGAVDRRTSLRDGRRSYLVRRVGFTFPSLPKASISAPPAPSAGMAAGTAPLVLA
ncbi:MAG: hypothetical protein ACYDDF_01275 [Thermoplasmatota archaeon]